MAGRKTMSIKTGVCTLSLTTACSWVFPVVVFFVCAAIIAIIYIMANAFMCRNC